MSESKRAFWCTHRDGYSIIAFPAELSTAHMAEVRDAGLHIIEQVSTVNHPACVVDLSALNYMGSSLVASVVRIWKVVKAKDGRMVVVASNQQIADVLKATGLAKVWTIVDSFEAGVHALGLSPEAKVEKRERRLLAFVSPIALAGTALAMLVTLKPEVIPTGVPPQWMIYNLAGLAILSSGVSMFREKGWRWFLSVFVLLTTVLLLSGFLWQTEFSGKTDRDEASDADSEKDDSKAARPGAVRIPVIPDAPRVDDTTLRMTTPADLTPDATPGAATTPGATVETDAPPTATATPATTENPAAPANNRSPAAAQAIPTTPGDASENAVPEPDDQQKPVTAPEVKP